MTEQRVLLSPCPFCGGHAEPDGIAELRWVRCRRCATTGPTGQTDAEAAERWNRRVHG